MKIEGLKNRKVAQRNEKKKASASVHSGLFSNIMEKSEMDLAIQALEETLQNINTRGEALKRSRNMADLKAYKKEIKKFFSRATEAIQAKQFSKIAPDGSMRLYTMIEKVDTVLQELSEEVLAKEQNTMAIIAKIDEIRGLLLDFFV